MNKLCVVFIFLATTTFGQFNPMFDSVDYFVRNKIKTIHEYHSRWYYGGAISYFKISFNSQSKSLRYDSLKFDPADSSFAKSFTGSSRRLLLRDTVYQRKNGYNDTLKYFYDSRKRLYKRIYISTVHKPNVPITSGKQRTTVTISPPVDDERIPYLTTTSYLYVDTFSKKIDKIITESPHSIETENFYYTHTLLSCKMSVRTNKTSHEVHFESMIYDYYPDKKLKRQTRRVSTDHCPDICEGTIDYKYDTDFENDSTPSGIIPHPPIITIKNSKKSQVLIEIYGYKSANAKKERTWGVPSLVSGEAYEIVLDPRSEGAIHVRHQFDRYFKKDEFTDLEIHVFSRPAKYVQYAGTPKDTLYFEKIKIKPLFKTPKTIIVSEKN